MNHNEKLLTTKQAAQRLGISRSLMCHLIKTGECPSLKIGGARRIPASAIDRLIAKLLEDQQDAGGWM